MNNGQALKNVLYFQHDYHARHDPKLERLFLRQGVAGIGIFWCIVEMLYEQGGYLKISDIEIYANSLKIDKELLRKILFDFSLFQSDKDNFWSDLVIERLSFMKLKREKASESAKNRWDKNFKRNKKEEPKPPAIEKQTHLEFVKLFSLEHEKLIQKLGENNTKLLIERLNNYLGSKGVKYKSHYHTLLNWASKDNIKKPQENQYVKPPEKIEKGENFTPKIHKLLQDTIKSIGEKPKGKNE